MFHFTKEERTVLIIVGLILFCGVCLHFVFKKNPQLKNIVNVVESEKIYHKVNINAATYEDLVKIPRIGEVTAKRIIAYREEQKGFQSLEELKSINGIGTSSYQIIIKYLKPLP